MPFDIRQLIEMAPLVIGAMKPGSPEAAAMMRGFMRSQQQRQQQERENQQLQEQHAFRDVQMQNMQADNRRADDAFRMQQENATLNRLEKYREAASGRANELIGGADLNMSPTDPGLQNQIALDQFQLANQYGVPGAQSTTLPNVIAPLSTRKRNKAKEIYEQAKKTYGDEAMANDAITIKTGELFGDVKPSQLRGMYELPAVQARPSAAAPTPQVDEPAFQSWYRRIAGQMGLNTNPDDPSHFYDYRGAFASGASPDASGHWPSQYKREGHPNLVIDGIDTRTGRPADADGQLARPYVKPAAKRAPVRVETVDAKGRPITKFVSEEEAAGKEFPQYVKPEKGAPDGQPSPYAAERGARNLASVDALLQKVNRWTTGVGSTLAKIPETQARDFAAELDTLKANIAFGELTAMREASKTGGALGQVSDNELRLLTSALGALDTGQSPANFRAQLSKIRESLARWDAASGGAAKPMPSHGATTGAADDALAILNQRRLTRRQP